VQPLILLRLIKEGEARLAVVALVVLLLVAASVSLVVGFKLMPHDQARASGDRLVLDGPAAAAKGWPSSTPHDSPWPPPDDWDRFRGGGVWVYSINALDPARTSGSSYSMGLVRAGWPLPVLERKSVWWDWSNPALKFPDPDLPVQILYGRLAFNTVVLGGGLWLVLFGPLLLFVVGRRVLRVLRGTKMVGIKSCPECGWLASGQGNRPGDEANAV
jgi:hypothetical protein